ncbi:MAG TPA: anti-sigma factor antagonist [Leptospiraceae bacterium]|nr:anti-sigma factor antagonist [Leptospiraceae bacterium]HNN02350.1 anti-sigma factor antagonist [Leptospiraceae bacterium]HNO22431.1 anti-sigma factor antagonist [Leptospiraceae bacterium]
MELEAKLESPQFQKHSSQINHLLIKMKTPPAVSTEQRQPLVIGLAIDKSWSMKGDKIEATIEAASSLVNWLTRNDYVAIVAYSADVQVLQPFVQLKDKHAVVEKIRSLQVGTSTNLSGGWLQTLKIVETSNIPNSYKRVILLTDGQATLGIKDQAQFEQIAKDHFGRGISTTTIGFGNDFNEASLKAIADNGGGNFYFVSSPEEASGIFFKEFGDIGSLYAQAVEVKIRFSEGVRMMDLFNEFPYTSESDGSVSIQAGDIRSDDIRSIVLALEINSDKEINLKEVAKVEVTYYNLFDKTKLEKISYSISGEYSNNVIVDNEVVVERLIYSSAKTIVKAARLLQDNQIEVAKTLVNSAIEKIEDHMALSPEVLSSVLGRLRNMSARLRENVHTAGKHFMATGAEIFSRKEIIDTGGIETHDRIFEYKTVGDVDLYKCPDIKALVQNQIKDGYKFIIFDLADTTFIDSSGIGAFIQIAGWLRRRGGELVVTNITDGVKRVFEVTRLENHIRLAESMNEARDIIESIITSMQRTN